MRVSRNDGPSLASTAAMASRWALERSMASSNVSMSLRGNVPLIASERRMPSSSSDCTMLTLANWCSAM
jgi:hypothetical protein